MILESCGTTEQQELREFPDWFHENLNRYSRGTHAMGEPHLMEIVRIAYNHKRGLLNREQVGHLGYLRLIEDEAAKIKDTDIAVNAVRRAREKTKRQFDEGIARLLKGLMPCPAKAIGRKGTEIRAPLDDAEMEKNFAKWTARIQTLGGQVTTDSWAPAWYHEAEAAYLADLDAAYWASVPEWERESHADYIEALCRNPEDEADRSTVCQSAPPQPWHPASVLHLKLWFGGRDWSPWQHAIEGDFWTDVRGDDLSDFLDRADARREAAYLTKIVLAGARAA
ncbi:hypothetical protein [Paraburkholderia caribensis]|uniref:hypothetical protein n=1 Tax=Paraburkholderia caribensis TaxID=75105 RepID=UPI00285BF638|nr:hypothetical protein [Paraburkholderia caribensis]MDR6383991.1 hypothetical protein [Paraburkholderia caribensis]